jgi:hypothetical protein
MSKNLREPILMCATGTKGVGKTYATLQLIDSYVKPNPKTGKKARKVLIYDVNKEYTQYKVISLKDIGKFTRQDKVEVRRVLPVHDNGEEADFDQYIVILEQIIAQYRGGLLVLEDINRYLLQAKSSKVVGLLTTNRHRDLDIMCHYQSLSALDPRMWQNTAYVRFHYQIDDIKRYRQRIPNYELFKLAQCLVEYRYNNCKDQRFYCFVSNEYNYIAGAFNHNDFKNACLLFFQKHPEVIRDAARMLGKGMDALRKAQQKVIRDLTEKYYKGV